MDDPLGDLIKQSDNEDTSTLRRQLLRALASNDYGAFTRLIPITKDDFHDLKFLIRKG